MIDQIFGIERVQNEDGQGQRPPFIPTRVLVRAGQRTVEGIVVPQGYVFKHGALGLGMYPDEGVDLPDPNGLLVDNGGY